MEPAMKEFNLLYEPWIRVMRPDASVEEVTLPDALIHAHEYLSLAGEMPTQDVAMLRLLLAVMHAVFSRVDADGNEALLEDEDAALDRWSELWQLGQMPETPVREYLARYEERFWLFHPERPFYQANAAVIGTAYTPAKLNGELSESSNKVRLFSVRQGESKRTLTYSEAARWLLHVNGFDDTSAKPKGKNLPSVGAGWLGKLGLIYAYGNNLFETLMLNFVLFDCEEEEPWESAIPIWELPSQREKERVEIPLHRDQAALLTLQSRRLLLERENGNVTGYRLLGGDFFTRENAFVEQMTLWRPIYQKNEPVGYQPMRHDPSIRLWREFASLIGYADKSNEKKRKYRMPGLVGWHNRLLVRDCFDSNQDVVSYQLASIQYGDKDFFVADAFSDGVSFHLNLLGEVGASWRGRIIAEIDRCNKIAYYISILATNLRKASGGSGKAEETDGQKAKELFFYRVDVPFRRWLLSLNADQSDSEQNCLQRAWHEEVFQLSRTIGVELAANAGTAAYSGRYVLEAKEGSKEKEKVFYSTAKVLNWFVYQITKELKGRDEHADP